MNIHEQSTDSSPLSTTDSGTVYFDGVCGLCNTFINFLLHHDRQARLRFAPLQGETARERLPAADIERLGSLVYSERGKSWRHSAAVVRILRQLGPGWKFLGGLLWIVPRPIRDWGYRVIASNRYRLFGKHESCRMPTPEERDRFLP